MASMVAKACTGPSSHMRVKTTQQKKSRNKRKHRVDPYSAYPSNTIPLTSNELTYFKFSAEKFISHGDVDECDICDACQALSDALELNHGMPCDVDMSELEDIDTSEELYGTDWSGLAEFQLEELVLSSLDVIFKSAIRRIVVEGYSEELASKAILRSGLWYGREDIVTNIVENTLVLLRTGQEIDTSKGHYFEDLQEMGRFVLAELICLLREVRPFLSNGDTMWCLLMSDMNLSHACVADSYPSRSFLDVPSLNSNSSVSAQYPAKNELETSETNASSVHCKPGNVDSACGYRDMQSDIAGGAVDRSRLSPEATSDTNQSLVEYDYQNYVPETVEKLVSASKRTTLSTGDCGKNPKHAVDSTEDYGMKASVEATKGFDVGPSNTSHPLATVTRFLPVPAVDADATDDGSSFPKSNIPSILPQMLMNEPFSPPFADTELSLSIHAMDEEIALPVSYNIDASHLTSFASSNYDCPEQLYQPMTKDEVITNLSSRIKELQNLLQEWSEWTNQKVMQVARRLSKDKDELQALKQEKEDAERLRKQRQKIQEGALRQLSEMENALRKISGQIETGKATGQRLEAVNASLRREMEFAKLQAMESSFNCKEVLKREKTTLTHIQSFEKLKSALQNDLSGEKSTVAQLNQKLRKAKDCKGQIEARLNHEETANNELLSQLTSWRREREKLEACSQSKEDAIKSKAENNLRHHKEEVEKLEREISRLRLRAARSNTEALKRCDASKTNGSHMPKVIAESRHHYLEGSKRWAGQGLKRERECVMCLTEEISVVFLPCAHQVVCVDCNELHQKRGMNDCPSCRTPIERRICVLFARSLV